MWSRLVVAIALVPFAASACAPVGFAPGPTDDAGPDGDAEADDPYAWWEARRALRQAILDDYLAAHADELRAFLYEPVGTFGIPLEAVEALTSVMPDRWGPPEERLAAVGLGSDPFDPSRTLPLGLARFTSPTSGELVNLSCAACHVGRVIGTDGAIVPLVGAPNTAFDTIFTAFEDTAADPRWAQLGDGLVFETVRQALLLRRDVEERTIAGWTFDPARHPDAPDPFGRDQPGYFDSFATIFALQTLPESLLPSGASVVASVMPPAPGEADIMSIWRQRDRPTAEWDGTLPNAVYRNLAASIGAVGFGFAVNQDVSIAAAALGRDLPPPPYPFEVDGPSAERGAAHYQRYCARCHRAGSTALFAPSVTGTDPNRALSVTAEGRTRLIAALRAACTDDAVCDVGDDEIVRDLSAPGARGYLALPLDGIWARAPYLHNGSVPTLYHLLVPASRPARFVRGDLHYDRERVGFRWDAGGPTDRYAATYDTALAGRSNRGHDSSAFLGIDWATHPEELADLLAFLKTL